MTTPTEPDELQPFGNDPGPLAESTDLADLVDEEGRIIGSPANDEGVDEDEGDA